MLVNEEKLIESVKNGDASSFGSLVHQYKDLVFTLCFQMIKDRERAEEIAQDSFLKAYRNILSYRGDSKFSTWLYKITYNTCLTELRKIKHLHNEWKEVHSPTDHESGESMMVKSDRDRQLAEAMDQLKMEDRTLLQLFFLQELSIKEIAEVTSFSESKIKVRLHRAKHKLRSLIEENYLELKRG